MSDQVTSTGVDAGLLMAAAVLKAAGYTSEEACQQARVLAILLREGPLPRRETADVAF